MLLERTDRAEGHESPKVPFFREPSAARRLHTLRTARTTRTHEGSVMARTSTYTQCRLEKQIPAGTARLMSWIPSAFATVGRVVKLREEGDVWNDGWRVVETFQTRSEAEVNILSHAYTKQRKASDI
jgi:hypothetical protein